jgi:hypothetical protein
MWIYIAIIYYVDISKTILAARSEYFEALLYDSSQNLKQVVPTFLKLLKSLEHFSPKLS